jgi:ATP-dependent RNA helicase RhlE
VGDAISFVTPDEQGTLRSLERFIGRGIVRKRAEGFNYAASAPPFAESGGRERRPMPAAARPSHSARNSRGGGPGPRYGFALPSGGRGRRWGR